MKQARTLVILSLCLATLSISLLGTSARADEYSEVSALVRTGKLPEALGKADQYLQSQPRDPQMRFIKGVIQRDSGKTADAIATFTKLTEDFPELPEPYNNLAVLYAGQSQFDKARASLEMAIRTNPSYATAHENLGDIYAKLASQAYNKALQLDNSNQAAVAPKLALIREIFSTPAKSQRPTAAPATPVAPAVPVTPSQPVATAPVPKPPAAAATTGATAPITSPAVTSPSPTATLKPTSPTSTTPVPGAITSVAASTANDPHGKPTDGAESAVEAAVASWAKAWSARDVKGYLAAYGKDFDPPGTVSRQTWAEERQQRIASKTNINVKIDKLAVTVNGNHAIAKFLQDYKAGGLAVSSHKVLDFNKVGDRWMIVKETVIN